jgi:hypothetical protein
VVEADQALPELIHINIEAKSFRHDPELAHFSIYRLGRSTDDVEWVPGMCVFSSAAAISTYIWSHPDRLNMLYRVL